MKVWIVQSVDMSKEGETVSYIKYNDSCLRVFDSFEKAKEFVTNKMLKVFMYPEFHFSACDILASAFKGEQPLSVYVKDERDPSAYHYVITERTID